MKSRYVMILLVLLAASQASFGQLTSQQKRGKQIFTEGTSVSNKEITALLGEENTEVPASVVPCAHCHGRDGLGIAEGGAKPPKIIWTELMKPYGATTESGRHRPAYTQPLLKRAITMGIDAGGNHLQTLMPRFRMSQQDVADLIAYLKVLGTKSDPGVKNTSLNIGVVLPPAGQLASVSAAVRAVLAAYFAELNRSGGVYSRAIDLSFLELPPQREQCNIAVQRFLDEKPIFALTASFVSAGDVKFQEMLARDRIPMAGAITQDSPAGLNRFMFYLFSGLSEQARSLALFAIREKTLEESGRPVVLFSGETARVAAHAIDEEYKRQNGIDVEMVDIQPESTDVASVGASLRNHGVKTVFLLIPAIHQLQFLRTAQTLNWTPEIFTAASLAPAEFFDNKAGFGNAIHLSFPQLPYSESQDTEYRRLAAAYHLPSEHLAAQWAALASARLLVEGLKRSGRDLDREKLVESLEGLYEFKTGTTHSLTFGPNRRIGAWGAYIVTPGAEDNHVTSSQWIDLGEDTPVAMNR